MAGEQRDNWGQLRERRMSDPAAQQAYEAARLAFTLGAEVRRLREAHGWSQTELARHAQMTQSAVARFEAGGTVPTLPVLYRLTRALGVRLDVQINAVHQPAASEASLGGHQAATGQASSGERSAAERKSNADASRLSSGSSYRATTADARTKTAKAEAAKPGSPRAKKKSHPGMAAAS